ncbi:hypothetical protein BVX97_06060, partial [bacterium E08(2017)]
AMAEVQGYQARILDLEYDPDAQPVSTSFLERYNNYRDIHVDIADPDLPVWVELREALNQYKPNVVGLSIMSVRSAAAVVAAGIVRDVLPSALIVAGGAHPTVAYEELLLSRLVDLCVIGEGELTFVDILQSVSEDNLDWSRVGGLAYLDDESGSVIKSSPRLYMSNLDDLPMPARHASVGNVNRDGMGAMMTSRGCPFNCSYCASRLTWGRKVRYRDAESVVQEMVEVRDNYDVSNFFFWDDTFTMNAQRVMDICKLIRRQVPDARWSCMTRVDVVDKPLLKKMKKAGCESMSIGVESGVEATLKRINKNISLETVRHAARLLNSSGIYWSAFFMVGIPGESEEDILNTWNYVKSLNPARAIVSVFTPLPGTELYDQVSDAGLLPLDYDPSNYFQLGARNCFSSEVPAERFVGLVEWILNEVDLYNTKAARR